MPALKPDAMFRELANNLKDGVYLVDRDRLITFWNKGAEEISGFSAAEVVGHHCFANILRHIDETGNALCFRGCPLHNTMQDGTQRESVLFLHHKKGHRVPVTVQTHAIRDRDGKVIGGMEIFRSDSPDPVAFDALETLQKGLLIDPLTGIANRTFAEMQISGRISEFERYGWRFALFFIDIDQFKLINERHGWQIGDNSLEMVARSLCGVLRSHDFVARWTGDKFVAVLTKLEELKRLSALAERIRVIIAKSAIRSGEEIVRVTVSIGATMARPGDDLESLTKRAWQLMLKSHTSGQNRVTVDDHHDDEPTP